MAHLALRHTDQKGWISLSLMPKEKADELLSKAHSGDTLHVVTDDVRLDIYLLTYQVEQQLKDNDYVTVP